MAVQDHLHPILAWGASNSFPDYEAYLEYRTYFESLDSGGQGRIFKAVEIDPGFIRPRIHLGGVLPPAGWEGLRELIVPLYEPVREMPLNVEQQRIVGMIDRRLEGQWEDAYRIAQEELDRHPADSWRRFQVVYSAGWANRPHAVLEAFETLAWDSLAPALVKTVAVQSVCDALHRLERYDEEFALVRKSLETGPVSNWGYPPQWYGLRALIGLGRIDELAQRVDEILLKPIAGSRDPYIMVMASDELRAHGYPEAARAMAERSLGWWETHPDVPRRIDYSESLMRVGRIEEALAVLEGMMTEFPDNQPVLITAGLCVARLDDRERALEIDSRLAELGRAGIHTIKGLGEHGVVEYRSAQIAARLGDNERAISLLQEAVSASFFDYLLIHREPDFEPLWDDSEFQEILRPKG